MIHKRSPCATGFTLLEIIVYVGLLSVLCVGSWAALFGLMGNMDKTSADIRTQEDVDFVIAKLRWLGTGAQSIVTTPDGVVFTNVHIGIGSPVNIRIEHTMLTLSYAGSGAVDLLPTHLTQLTQGMPAFTYSEPNRELIVTIGVDNENIHRHIFFP